MELYFLRHAIAAEPGTVAVSHDSDRPLTEDEFDKARLGLIRGFPPTFETPSHVLRRLIDIVHYDLPDDHFSRQVERLQAVTLADVHRVASQHIDPSMLSIIVVGDRAVVEAPLRELEINVVLLDFEGLPA